MSERRARAWWWAPALVVLVMLNLVGITCIMRGETWLGLLWLAWSVLYFLQRAQQRAEYRRGWRAGFAESAAGPSEAHTGKVPAFVLRAQMRDGDPVPEPWDGVLSPDVRAVAVRHHHDDGNGKP